MKPFTKKLIVLIFTVGIVGITSAIFSPTKLKRHFDNIFLTELTEKFNSFHQGIPEDRVYLQFDKTIYQPGETVWFSAYVNDAKNMRPSKQSQILYVELVDPRGSVVKKLNLIVNSGKCTGEFDITEEINGGLYKVKAYTNWQRNEGKDHLFTKDLTVQKVILPDLKMKMDFIRKSYGPGDVVKANLILNTNANQALKNHRVKYIANIKGKSFVQKEAYTDESGKLIIKFDLPKNLDTSDGLLNVMVNFEGKNESISKSIPILLNNIDLNFFPEGGDLVVNHPTKIAFRALNEFKKPADIEGCVVDEGGNIITNFTSYHNGMGAFDFTPKFNKNYTVKIIKPYGIETTYQLPKALPKGYTFNINSTDKKVIKLHINSSKNEVLTIIGQVRGKIYFNHSLKAKIGQNNVNVLTKDFPMGVAQFTLFDSREIERAERLVFVNKDQQLNISVKTDKDQYLPREKVKMTINVTDEEGMPMPAHLSLAVTDDQLLTFADDKSANILSKMMLEYDIKEKVEEPSFYFDPKESKADLALNYLMMTAGWRRFTWKEIQDNQLPNISYQAEKTEVHGTIRDDYTMKPIPNAKIQLMNSNQSIVADKHGKFSIPNLELYDPIQLSIKADAYQTSNQSIHAYGEHDFYLYSNNIRDHLFVENGVVDMEEVAVEAEEIDLSIVEPNIIQIPKKIIDNQHNKEKIKRKRKVKSIRLYHDSFCKEILDSFKF